MDKSFKAQYHKTSYTDVGSMAQFHSMIGQPNMFSECSPPVVDPADKCRWLHYPWVWDS